MPSSNPLREILAMEDFDSGRLGKTSTNCTDSFRSTDSVEADMYWNQNCDFRSILSGDDVEVEISHAKDNLADDLSRISPDQALHARQDTHAQVEQHRVHESRLRGLSTAEQRRQASNTRRPLDVARRHARRCQRTRAAERTS